MFIPEKGILYLFDLVFTVEKGIFSTSGRDKQPKGASISQGQAYPTIGDGVNKAEGTRKISRTRTKQLLDHCSCLKPILFN